MLMRWIKSQFAVLRWPQILRCAMFAFFTLRCSVKWNYLRCCGFLCDWLMRCSLIFFGGVRDPPMSPSRREWRNLGMLKFDLSSILTRRQISLRFTLALQLSWFLVVFRRAKNETELKYTTKHSATHFYLRFIVWGGGEGHCPCRPSFVSKFITLCNEGTSWGDGNRRNSCRQTAIICISFSLF